MPKKPTPKAEKKPAAKKGGRPKTTLDEEQLELLRKLAGLFLNDEDIAYLLKISPRTFRDLKGREPDVFAAYKEGRAEKSQMVLEKYQQKLEKGDSASIFFYLKTQYGWRETNRTELTGPDGKPIGVESKVVRAFYPANGREVEDKAPGK